MLPNGRRTSIAVTPPSDILAALAWLAPDRVTAALQASLAEAPANSNACHAPNGPSACAALDRRDRRIGPRRGKFGHARPRSTAVPSPVPPRGIAAGGARCAHHRREQNQFTRRLNALAARFPGRDLISRDGPSRRVGRKTKPPTSLRSLNSLRDAVGNLNGCSDGDGRSPFEPRGDRPNSPPDRQRPVASRPARAAGAFSGVGVGPYTGVHSAQRPASDPPRLPRVRGARERLSLTPLNRHVRGI